VNQGVADPRLTAWLLRRIRLLYACSERYKTAVNIIYSDNSLIITNHFHSVNLSGFFTVLKGKLIL